MPGSGHTCLPTSPLLCVRQASCRPTSPFPPCPVDEQDGHVSVVTNDPNHLCTASCGLQHIATRRDIRLLMGDQTVKCDNELHVILYGISMQDAGEETFVPGIPQDCFSVWEWCVWR